MKYEKALIDVQDQKGYAQLNQRIDAAFQAGGVEGFLGKLASAGVRVRDFEGALKKGVLGADGAAVYAALPVSDQAQTRERYLALLEQVPMALRKKFLKVYAYY